MAKSYVVDDDDENEFEGFTNEDGEPVIIDDVTLDGERDSAYRSELKKLAVAGDPFSAIPYNALDRNAKRRATRLVNKQLQGSGGARPKHINVEQINGYELYGLAMPPYSLDNLVNLSVENDTHYACIVHKATNICGLGYKWKERSRVKEARQAVEEDEDKIKKLARKLQRVTDGLDEWLDGLNIEEDFNEILFKVWFDVEATGNGYLEISRTNAGKIGYVGHIPAATMRVRVNRDGFIQMVEDRLTFFRNFGDLVTPDYFGKDPRPNEVIHFKKHNAKNAYYGIPDIIAAMSSVAGEKFASEYNLDYFENKAVPRYALIVKGAKLSQQAERKILEYFRREVKGKHHNTLYIPVPAHAGSNVDVKLEPIENKVQEGSFEKYRAGNRESIAMVHRVPKSKLGIGGGVAAAREEAKSFKIQVVQPEQRRIAKKINRLVREVTDMYSFTFEEYDLLDAETISRINDRYIRLGVVSPDEVRGELGKHPRKGGGKYVDMAAESAAKTALLEAQVKQVEAAAEMALRAPEVKPIKGGTPGPERKTTDGSSKNKQELATPQDQKAEGRGVAGTAEDKGEQTKSTRR